MDFEEWFESLDLDNWTNKKYMHDAFEAGQQSKQAEIDALQEMYIKQWLTIAKLQKRINEAMELLEYKEYTDSHLQALGVLKGELK